MKNNKVIVFEDNDFVEKNVNWWSEDLWDEEAREKAGFVLVHYDEDYAQPLGFTIWNSDRDRWLVIVENGFDGTMFVVESRVDYLRLLNSPMLSTLNTQRHTLALRTMVERIFRAWHGHPAPSHPFDYSRGCARCDPEQNHKREAEKRRQEARRETLHQELRTESSSR